MCEKNTKIKINDHIYINYIIIKLKPILMTFRLSTLNERAIVFFAMSTKRNNLEFVNLYTKPLKVPRAYIYIQVSAS